MCLTSILGPTTTVQHSSLEPKGDVWWSRELERGLLYVVPTGRDGK
jgi:hypothetical protein